MCYDNDYDGDATGAISVMLSIATHIHVHSYTIHTRTGGVSSDLKMFVLS